VPPMLPPLWLLLRTTTMTVGANFRATSGIGAEKNVLNTRTSINAWPITPTAYHIARGTRRHIRSSENKEMYVCVASERGTFPRTNTVQCVRRGRVNLGGVESEDDSIKNNNLATTNIR
jgi:hypothetical protein